MALITGGCVCGNVRYECDAPPIMMFKCHCRDCQYVTGSGYAPVLYFQRNGVRIVKGALKYYSTQSMAGGEHKRGFCADCGCRISGGESAKGIGITAGSLDDPALFEPTMDIHVADVEPWDLLDPSTQKFEAYPSF